MAFRFGSPSTPAFGNASGASTNSQQTGPELEEIQTEVSSVPRLKDGYGTNSVFKALGFQSLAGESKVQLVPAWPAEALPLPTSSLLSIAPSKGLLAAAGPDTVVIAGTEAVRKAFTSNDTGGGIVKSFTPQLTLELGMRISQVAFSADEAFLVLSAEDGGGLAVYDVRSLMQGNTQSAFQISTNGAALRMLLPNPTPEKAELFAAVTVKGELLMANLASRQFMNGPQGITMKEGVSCVSWSARGKQLVAGLGDGTCYQMTPEGAGKANIPTPPDLEGSQHVSTLSWLENELFLVAHTTSTQDKGIIPVTTFRLITRQPQPQTSYTYQKLPDPVSPFGVNRSPPYQFLQRLRNFPPHLTDLLVITSTTSTDVGLLSRADIALASDVEAEKITKVFTTTTMANDTRRAQLPMDEDLSDTSPIGMALDLSATEKVPRPLPNEEMDESPGPLPALMILNNEGLLASWWIVYADSIRQGTTYPGLTAVVGNRNQVPTTKSASPFPPSPSANTSGTAPPQNSSFPNTSTPAFGDAGSNSAFGASSSLGSKPSPWGLGTATAGPSHGMGATFGKPAFGTSTPFGAATGGAAFGAAGGLGNRPSPWGASAAGTQAVGTTFGQGTNSGMGAGSAFGNNNAYAAPNAQPSSGGFASFAKGPGFAAAAATQQGGESPFSRPGQKAPFSSGMETDSVFGGTSNKVEAAPTSLFGGGGFGGSFTLGSTFKGDGTSATDGPKPATTANNSLFGVDFDSKLGDTQKQPAAPESKETEMGEDGGASEHEAMSEASEDDGQSATPASRPRQPVFGFQQTTPPVHGGLFGTQARTETTPAMVQNSIPASVPATQPAPASTTPKTTPKKPEDAARPLIETPPPTIKPEPVDDSLSGINEAVPKGPKPPDTTSKDSYSPGDTSQSSGSDSKATNDDAPQPPDFLPSKARPIPLERSQEEETALPEGDDSGLDDEGSGVDVAKEISPTTDPTQTPKITPGSSFGAALDKSPQGLFSSKGQPNAISKPKSLFGEVDQSPAFQFPPPKKIQESPRSPSPVRSSQLIDDNLRPDNVRSMSAPHGNFKTSHARKLGNKVSAAPADPQPSLEEMRKREQELLSQLRAQREEEERQALDDQQDEEIRRLLETEIEPTTVLEEFIAHEDYNEEESKPGLPGQIEKVYRDINSMIDTIGLNARNLEAFTMGHTEWCKRDGRSRDDLEELDWCLGEVSDLSDVGNQVSEQVDDSRIPDVRTKLAELRDFRTDIQKLKVRQHDILKVVAARNDTEKVEAARYAPLAADQASKQKHLRNAFKNIQELTDEAEKKALELRTDLASQQKDSNDRLTKKPTVENVMSTILKMTHMVEKKSGDIDMLEARMRKLRVPIATSNGSREGSPFKGSLSRTSPDHADSLSKSMGGMRLSVRQKGTPMKGENDVRSKEVERYRSKVRQRKAMNAVVKQVLKGDRPIVRALE
ncbi:MAG: hypothetical protein Q9186_003837 [Xanthomendoza sp. 1 TL-2023]